MSLKFRTGNLLTYIHSWPLRSPPFFLHRKVINKSVIVKDESVP